MADECMRHILSTSSPSLLSSNTPSSSSPQTHHTPSYHHHPSSLQIHLLLILLFLKHLPTPQVNFVPQVPPAQMASVMMGMRAVAEVTIIDNDNGMI